MQEKTTRGQITSRLLYSVNDAAEILSISRTTLYKKINSGEVLQVKISGRTLVPQSSLDSYVKRLKALARENEATKAARRAS
jgi:excisionase family DNA binding protein